jgi:iron complex transport system ATP-binding protein
MADAPDRPQTAVPSAVASGHALVTQGARLERDGHLLCRDVSLSLSRGTVTSIIGPNGAGKSSLVALLSGDVEPSAGSVSLDGRPIHAIPSLELARERAVLTQSQDMSFPFRVHDVVAMGRYPWAKRPESRADDDIVRESMLVCDVAHLANRPVTRLSGGETSRVALARVLAQRAPILLLDEPTAALDVKHQELVMDVAINRARHGDLVVVVMHDLNMAMAMSDQVVVMADGTIAVHGRPHDVVTSELLSEIYDHPIEVIADGEHLDVRPTRKSKT